MNRVCKLKSRWGYIVHGFDSKLYHALCGIGLFSLSHKVLVKVPLELTQKDYPLEV